MIAGEVGIDALVEFTVAGIAHIQRRVAAIIFREFLLDDVGLNSDAEMVGLSGEVGGDVKVFVFLESVVAEIAPQHGGHAKFVSLGEGLADFDNLAATLLGAEINGGAHRGSAHVVGFLNGAKENLVGFIGIGEQLVVVEFYDERNFVGVLAGDGAQHAEGGGHGVAVAFHGELDDIFGVEIIGIFRKAGTSGMLDALIHRKNGQVAGVGQASAAEHALQVGDHANTAIGNGPDAINEVGSGEMQAIFGNFGSVEAQQRFCFRSQVGFDFSGACAGGHLFLLFILGFR